MEISCLKCARKLFIKFLMCYYLALYSKIQLTENAQGKKNQCLVHAVSEYPVFQHTFTFDVVGWLVDVVGWLVQVELLRCQL